METLTKQEKIKNIVIADPISQKENRWYYEDIQMPEEKVSDSLDKIKTLFKNFNAVYYFLIYVVSPVYPSMMFRLKKFLKNTSDDSVILNLGSGNSHYGNQIINVDLLPYEHVDVVCDLSRLPFKDQSVDAIVNIAVLEHVPYPEKAIAEMHRVLKKNGKIFSFIPFIQGFHASPYDFQRFTFEGMKIQFQEFTILHIYPEGPTSGLLWIVQEWFALVFSFGIKPLHNIIYLVIMGLTFPFKFLDVILIHFPMAKNISTGFTLVGEKK